MPSRPIALSEEYYLALRYLAERRQYAKRKIEGKVKAGFYYEGCEYFPGTIENAKMPLFSMLVAIFEMMRLEHYRDVRKANFKLLSERISKVPGCHIIATENVETASQIGMVVEDDIALSTIAKSLAELKVAVRRPYSRFDDPGSSARPRLYSVENPFHRISMS